MIGSTLWAVVVATLCLGTGLVGLAFAAAGGGDRGAWLAHAAMGVAMAGMFSPWGDPVPGWVGAAGFAVLGAWFVAVVLRRDRSRGTAQHLAISSAAMVLMYLMHHSSAEMSGMPATGAHAGHAAGSGGGAGLVALPLALALTGYFVWHTWTCVERSRTPGASPDPTSTPHREPGAAPAAVATSWAAPAVTARVEPLAHGVMSALMAAMFLLMV